MRLSLLIKPEHVFLDLAAPDRDTVLREVAERLAKAGARTPDELVTAPAGLEGKP